MARTRRTRKNREDGKGRETKRQKIGQQKSPIITDAVLDEHLVAARPFIIRNFVAKDGPSECARLWRELAGTKWQQDILVCMHALSCGLPPEELENNSILEDAGALADLLRNTKNLGQAKELWNMLSQEMKQTKSVAFGAITRGIPFSKICKEASNEIHDKEVLKDGLRKGLLPWLKLPMKYRKDVEFVLAAFYRPDFSVALATVVGEKEKSRLWYEWAVQSPQDTESECEIWESAPRGLVRDKKLMLQVIGKAAFVLDYADSSLKEDEGFLVTAIGRNPLALEHLSSETFRRFPSLLSVDNIQKYKKSSGKQYCSWDNRLEHNIPKEFWDDRDFVLETWLAAGQGCGLHRGMPEQHFDDEEIILAAAELWHDDGSKYSRMSERLRSNKAFIEKLLGIAPAVDIESIARAVMDTPLEKDYGLQVLACAMTPFYKPYIYDYYSSPRWGRQKDFRNFIREQLRQYSGFCQLLFGIDHSADSPLFHLNQGSDASIKMTIASFVDFPTGATQHLRKAAKHLNLSADDEDEEVPATYQRPNQHPSPTSDADGDITTLTSNDDEPDPTGQLEDTDGDIFADSDDEDIEPALPPRQPAVRWGARRNELFGADSDSDSDSDDGIFADSDDEVGGRPADVAPVWFVERVCVRLKSNNDAAVIKEVASDGTALVEFDDKSTRFVQAGEVTMVPPREHDMVLVTSGPECNVGAEGELVCIDGTDAILKDSNEDFKIVDFVCLAKIVEESEEDDSSDDEGSDAGRDDGEDGDDDGPVPSQHSVPHIFRGKVIHDDTSDSEDSESA